jgi:hypothetical protein
MWTRPIGKSTLISTLDALFSGREELFEGLCIYDKWDWSKSNSIIRIDWTAIKHGTPEEMEADVSEFLQGIAICRLFYRFFRDFATTEKANFLLIVFFTCKVIYINCLHHITACFLSTYPNFFY